MPRRMSRTRSFPCPSWNRPNRSSQSLESRRQKVPLTDIADVCSLPADRDGGVAVVPHLFQSLAEGAVVIEICDSRVLPEN